MEQGCIFFVLSMSNWLAKEKYGDSLRKNANIKGKRWKNEGEGQSFAVLWEKQNFGKKGGGQKYHILGK